MKSSGNLREDERGVMVFALVGVVIILLSVAATAYFANIKRQSQREVVDTAGLEDIGEEIENIKAELESAAFESGQIAVKKVRKEISRGNRLPHMNVLKEKVSENTTRAFEDYFEKHYGETIEKRGQEMTFHLTPVKITERGVDFDTLFVKEQRGKELVWEELPGFFTIEREVRVNVQDKSTGTFTTRKFTIEREVKTDLFILAERLKRFDIENVGKITDCMLFAYLNTKIYNNDLEKDIGFQDSFQESFDTEWFEEYDGVRKDFDSGEERETPYEWNSSGFIRGFHRDRGRSPISSVLSEEEIEYTAKLAFLIEQIRTFRTCDESLLEDISKYFSISQKKLKDLIGSGRGNKLNLQNLIIKLFVEKGELSEEVFYPDLFLQSFTEDGILSLIEKGETKTSFGLLKNLFEGRVLDDRRWTFDEFSDRITSLSDLASNSSYLRTLFALYTNTMEQVLNSFAGDSEELEDFVLNEIRLNDPLPAMEDIGIIGKSGTEKIARSIVHTSKNLSESFGLEESPSSKAGFSFYYLYFLSNWGIESTKEEKVDPAEKMNFEGIPDIVSSRIVNELKTREKNLNTEIEYSEVVAEIEDYNETEWYDGSGAQKEAWAALNESLSPLENISEKKMFDPDGDDNTSEALEEFYPLLKEDIEQIRDKLSPLNEKARDYTENIVETESNFTSSKWRCEAYGFLVEKRKEKDDHIRYFQKVNNYLTASPTDLSGTYEWALKDFELADYIEIPPEEPDQSVGYETVGLFTEEAVRGFKTPLKYTNPSRFFTLINQNLYDLKGARGSRDESRLKNILKGEGDPFSDELNSDHLSTAAVDIGQVKTHSDEIREIDGWWNEEKMTKTAVKLKNASKLLEERAKGLEKKDLEEKPYRSYSDASFYRTADEFLDPIISELRQYEKRISNISHRTGYLYRFDGEDKKIPVVKAPRGELTVTDSKSIQNRSLSYSLDFQLDMNFDGSLIDMQDIHSPATKDYRGDISNVQEWVNPFSDSYNDSYKTSFFAEYLTSSFELSVSIGGENVLTSEMYSSSGLTKRFETDRLLSFTETVTPVPVIDKIYTPSSSSTVEIEDLSIGRNVFNSSKNTAQISFQTGKISDEKGFFIQLYKSSISEHSNFWKRETNHLYDLLDNREEDRTLLLNRKISPEEVKDDEIELTFDMNGIDFSQAEKSSFVVRIKPETETAWMKDSFSLDQSVNTSEVEEQYSTVPQFADSEQLYVLPEDRPSYLGVFRWNGENTKRNRFDLIKNVPEDSRVVEKNGIPYLLDLSEDKEFRDILSGRYETISAEPMIDSSYVVPSYEVGDISSFSSSFLPDNDYRSLLNTDLVPLYMSSSEDGENLYPDSMVSLPEKEVPEDRNSVYEMLEKNNYRIEAKIDESGHLSYRPGYYSGKKEVDHSFEYARKRMIDSKHPTARSRSRISRNIKEATRSLKRAGLIEEFIKADSRKRRGLFLAASWTDENMKAVEDIDDEYESFTIGNIAKSVNILGVERSKKLFEWLKNERSSFYDRELRAFLSFDRDLLQNLKSETESETYSEALDSIDPTSDGMTFTDCRKWGVKTKADFEALHYLKSNLPENAVLKAAGFGLRPATLQDLNRSDHQFDLDRLPALLKRISKHPYFDKFIERLNSGDHSRLPSVYLAGEKDGENIEWMPFGEDGAPLLIEDRAAFYNSTSAANIESVKRCIDRTLRDASEEFGAGRGIAIIDVRSSSLDKDQVGELYSFVKNRTHNHSPDFKSVGSVEVMIKGDTGFKYIHL